MSIKNEDLLDEGLQAVMGKDRCQDVSGTVNVESVVSPKPKNAVPKGEPGNAGWIQLNTVSPMVKLKSCAKWALLWASISALLFYWQQAGLLASSAAVPSLIFCGLGAGLTVGYNAK